MSKWLFLFLAVLYSVAVSAPLCAQEQRNDMAGPAAANPMIQQLVNQVSKDSMFAYIRKLEAFGTRYEYTPQRDSAATYVINTLRRWGYSPESDVFSYSMADFNGLDMIDQNNAWVIGQDVRDQQNLLLRTTDGGKTWILQIPPKATSLSAVDFVNARTGWIVGSGGGIFKTTDSGVSWQTQNSVTSSQLLDVKFANDQLGIAVGYAGALLRTTDGGTTWNAVSWGGTNSLRKCKTLAGQLMWVVGSAGAVLSSRDAGVTWTKRNSGVTADLSSVDFADSLNGWAVGSMATVLRTSDGGKTWLNVSLPAVARRSSDRRNEDVVALSPDSAVAMSVGEIWRTDDGGSSWKRISNIGSHSLRGLGGQSILTFGSSAGIYRSTNGGSTWQVWDQNIPRSLYSTTRNCVATMTGSISPEKEYIILAHYDSPSGNDPGADNNGSGVAAALEAMRLLKTVTFESTIRFVATSGKETGLLGSNRYVSLAKAQGRDIRLVMNLDMVGYPVTSDTSRVVVGSYLKRSAFVDSALVFNSRYALGMKFDSPIDSSRDGDSYPFDFAGYEALQISEGTATQILQGNPYFLKPTDTSDKLHRGMVQRAAQLVMSVAAELAKPVAAPQKAWTWKIPFDRWNNLRSLSVVDSNVAFAAGDYGTLIKTTNEGRNWSQVAIGTLIPLRGVSFIDSSRGVVVGDQGTILMTTNGGKTWTGKSYDVAITFNDVCLVDQSYGVAVGSNGALYQTNDGGITWAPQFATPLVTLYSVTFVDRKNGIFVGSSGTVFRTTDGGVRWSRQVSGLEGPIALSLLDVCMINANNGVAVGEFGTILRTSNGGANWSLQQNVTKVILRGVHFADVNRGFAVGDGGLILVTADGGSTWSEQSNGTTSWFSAVRFATPNMGFAVGSDGMLIRTTDAGATWTSQTGGPRVPLYAVRFIDALKGVVVGYQGSIYRTIDGGVSWEAQVSGTTEELRGIDFPTANTGIIVGDNGTILRSTNGGVTWQYTKYQRESAIFFFSSVAFSSSSTGIIVGREDSTSVTGKVLTSSCILRTIDGGLNWVQVPASWTNELMSVSFGGASTVHAVGLGGFILCSTDGGISWFAQAGVKDPETGVVPPPTMNLKGVSFAGPSLGVAVGESGTVLRTLNGGTTWTLQPAVTHSNLTGVWTVNGVNVLAVGLAGAVLVSNDAGGSWIGQATETSNDLYAVHFTDVDRGTIVGDRGIILRTLLASVVPTGVQDNEATSVPSVFSLAQNYPNPFNGMTTIEFELSRTSSVVLRLFDLLGRQVATLVDEVKSPGSYRLLWDAKNLPSGVYFYRLSVGDFLATKKMLLLK